MRRIFATHWLIVAAAGVIIPKCLLCVAGDAGLATSIDWMGPEICGESGEGHWAAILGFAMLGVIAAVGYGRPGSSQTAGIDCR